MRDNLDPVGFYSLRQISDVIKRCKLDTLISKLGGESQLNVNVGSLIPLSSGYSGQITEQGGSLSAGQKQLLCLARAVLSPCKIVLIDEATANVDADTDRHLQVCLDHITLSTFLINCIKNFVKLI